MVRPPAPCTHPPIHAGPASQRDRAGDLSGLPRVPGVLAARRRSPHAGGPSRRAHRAPPARGIRSAGCAVGNPCTPRPRPGLSPGMARSGHAVGRIRVGPALGLWSVCGKGDADRLLSARRAGVLAGHGRRRAHTGRRLRRSGIFGAGVSRRGVPPRSWSPPRGSFPPRSRWASPN